MPGAKIRSPSKPLRRERNSADYEEDGSVRQLKKVTRHHLNRICLLLSLVLAAPQIRAEEPVEIPGIVITASRLPVHTEATGALAARLERDDIERISPSTTAELLRGLPNLHVSRSGGAAYVHLRGGDPNHTVILIDGVQVNDPMDVRGGTFDLNSIDPSEIERLEVLRSPGSSAHGSDAMAGVIHLHTRERTAIPWLTAEGGRLGHSAISGGAGTTIGAASVTASVHERRGGEALDGHEYRTRGGHARVAFADIAGSRLRLTARFTDDERTAHPEGSGGTLAILKELEERDGRQLQFGARGARTIGTHNDIEAWLAFARQQSDVVSPGAVDAANPFATVPASTIDSDFRRTTIGLSLRRSLGGLLHLFTSGEVEIEDGDNDGSIDLGASGSAPTAFNLQRRAQSLAVEVLRDSDHLNLHAAIRLDDGEDFEHEWSPRLGLRYQSPIAGTVLTTSWSQGFKQPSLYAVGNPLVGNADLNAETSWTIDAGVSHSLSAGRLLLELNGFHTRYRDLIDFDFESFRLLNRSRVRAEGLELTAAAILPAGLSFHGTGSLTSTEVKSTGRPLLERPGWIVDATLGWESPHHRRRGQMRLTVVDDIPSASLATGPRRLDGYARVDVSTSMPLTARLRLRLAVDNLLDADYDDAVGIPAPGALPRVGLQGEL